MSDTTIKITALSDLHGYRPVLPGGDLLIIAGDITAADGIIEWGEFFHWLKEQDYQEKILVAGNHDNFLQLCLSDEDSRAFFEDYSLHDEFPSDDFRYLRDSGFEFEGIKIWGSPWSLSFPGIHPGCRAFTEPEDELLKQYWDMIPADTDILITHTPPYGILDKTKSGVLAGSKTLYNRILQVKPRLHIFGHIHEQWGRRCENDDSFFFNLSFVNERYQRRKDFTEINYVKLTTGEI